MVNIEKGKPLQLPDGSVVLPGSKGSGSKVVTKHDIEQKLAEEQTEQELRELIETPFESAGDARVTRTLADINVDFNHMNVAMLVASYHMWGLDSFAMSHLLKINQEHVESILDSDLCQQIKTDLVEAMRYAESASVHGYIQSKTLAAAKVVVSSLTSKKEEHRLTAARDLLDRGGFRPVDRVEHNHKFEDDLRIRVMRDAPIPTIDLTLEK